MSRIGEILSSGIAPGMRRGVKDPTSAEVAVPRAFRRLEETMPLREIERQSGFKAKQIKKAWKFNE